MSTIKKNSNKNKDFLRVYWLQGVCHKRSLPKHVFLLSLFFVHFGAKAQSFSYEETRKFQNELIEEYENPKTTPLKEDDKNHFKGLEFYPISPNYYVLATFERATKDSIYDFPTSAQKIKTYTNYGTLRFTINDVPCALTLFKKHPSDGENYLFLPFRDKTSGATSYGAGRYIDILTSDLEGNTFYIDFNRAYNPYCAYSTHYNCPIPPRQNWLPVSVEAGVSYIANE